MLRRLGLLTFTAIFVRGGWNETVGAEHYAEMGLKAGVPATAQGVKLFGWTMVGAAAALQIPFLRRLAALVLAGQLAAVTYVGHRFWEVEGGQRDTQLTHAFKNTSLFGAALFIA